MQAEFPLDTHKSIRYLTPFCGAHVELVFHVRFHLTAVTLRGRVIHGLLLDTVQKQRSQTFNLQPKSERNKERKEKKNGSDGVRTCDPSNLHWMT